MNRTPSSLNIKANVQPISEANLNRNSFVASGKQLVFEFQNTIFSGGSRGATSPGSATEYYVFKFKYHPATNGTQFFPFRIHWTSAPPNGKSWIRQWYSSLKENTNGEGLMAQLIALIHKFTILTSRTFSPTLSGGVDCWAWVFHPIVVSIE